MISLIVIIALAGLLFLICSLDELHQSKSRWNKRDEEIKSRGWTYDEFVQWDKETNKEVKARLEAIFNERHKGGHNE